MTMMMVIITIINKTKATRKEMYQYNLNGARFCAVRPWIVFVLHSLVHRHMHTALTSQLCSESATGNCDDECPSTTQHADFFFTPLRDSGRFWRTLQ